MKIFEKVYNEGKKYLYFIQNLLNNKPNIICEYKIKNNSEIQILNCYKEVKGMILIRIGIKLN